MENIFFCKKEIFFNKRIFLVLLAISVLFINAKPVNANVSLLIYKSKNKTNPGEKINNNIEAQNDKNKNNNLKLDKKTEDKNKQITTYKNNDRNNDEINVNNYSSTNNNEINVNSGKDDIKNNKESEIKLNIGGYTDVQYFNTKQLGQYGNPLPNENQHSIRYEAKDFYLVSDGRNTLNLVGSIDINPEFNRYKITNDNIRKKIYSIGLKIKQPFYNAYKTSDPTLKPDEYLYLKTKYFQFHIGAVSSTAVSMKVDADGMAGPNGGVYGSWWKYVSLPVFDTAGLPQNEVNMLNAILPVYMLHPELPNNSVYISNNFGINRSYTDSNFVKNLNYYNEDSNSNKISMYFKRIKGFGFGISYSPRTGNTGYMTKAINRYHYTFEKISEGALKNYTSIAIDYRKNFDRYGIGIALSFTYEYGETLPINRTYTTQTSDIKNLSNSRYNLNAFAIGSKIVYKNYSFAYSYGNWGNSFLIKKGIVIYDDKYQFLNKNKASFYHTAGFEANHGPVHAGTTYMHSSFTGNALDVFSFGLDYKIVTLNYLHIQPYFEYVCYFFHTQKINVKVTDSDILYNISTYKAVKNNGHVIIIGIKVVF